MLFVVDRPRLQRIISIVRDDRAPAAQMNQGPFLRVEAADDRLKLSGQIVEAEFPATVYEPCVLFLRVTIFRRLLGTMRLKELGVRHMTFQANSDGLMFGDVRLPFNVGEMLLYPDPTTAPQQHPEERPADVLDEPDIPPDPQGKLFEGL